MRHPDEVLSRSRILEHVWDFAYEGGSNVVDVYVRYLREKVDRPFGQADIQTVRVGYRLRIDDDGRQGSRPRSAPADRRGRSRSRWRLTPSGRVRTLSVAILPTSLRSRLAVLFAVGSAVMMLVLDGGSLRRARSCAALVGRPGPAHPPTI